MLLGILGLLLFHLLLHEYRVLLNVLSGLFKFLGILERLAFTLAHLLGLGIDTFNPGFVGVDTVLRVAACDHLVCNLIQIVPHTAGTHHGIALQIRAGILCAFVYHGLHLTAVPF